MQDKGIADSSSCFFGDTLNSNRTSGKTKYNENRKAEEKDFKCEKNYQIKLPSEVQEIFNRKFKDIHNEEKNGIEKFNEE